jgi:hypothetical protein
MIGSMMEVVYGILADALVFGENVGTKGRMIMMMMMVVASCWHFLAIE